MARLESLREEWVKLEIGKLTQLPSAAGVFELGDINREVIYIGTARDLNKDLLPYLSSDNGCLRQAKYFRVSINPELQRGELYLFKRYKEDNDNRIPRCNRRDPTRLIR